MMRRGILFTEDDVRVLESLKEKLRPTHGTLGLTAIVRLAIRNLLKRSK